LRREKFDSLSILVALPPPFDPLPHEFKAIVVQVRQSLDGNQRLFREDVGIAQVQTLPDDEG